MISGTTKSGFEYQIDENIGTNWWFVKAVANLQKGDILQIPVVLGMLLGDGGEDKLEKHVMAKDQTDYPNTLSMMEEINEIMESTKDTKNS